MAKEWTDEEVSSAIAEAVRIVREDRFETFVRSRIAPPDPDKDKPKTDPGNPGGNPPIGDGAPKKAKSLWWGETE